MAFFFANNQRKVSCKIICISCSLHQLLFSSRGLIYFNVKRHIFPLQTTDMACCSCCRLVQRRVRGRGGKGEVGDIHAHFSWALISWPCNGAFAVLHQEREKDSDRCQSILGGAEVDWCYPASQLVAGLCYYCSETSPTPAPFLCRLVCVCVCVWVWNACLPVFIVAAQAAVGCVGWLWETQPLFGSPGLILHQRADLG